MKNKFAIFVPHRGVYQNGSQTKISIGVSVPQVLGKEKMVSSSTLGL